ncbi:MAG TPA: hypothetical protein VGJ95_21660 [Pseudonocardiaceae bacterium]|jgi:hypothetical protein
MADPTWLHVLIDVPAEAADTARRFWSAATGWAVGRLPFCVTVQGRELAS